MLNPTFRKETLQRWACPFSSAFEQIDCQTSVLGDTAAATRIMTESVQLKQTGHGVIPLRGFFL
jgi:hypothetical protein